MAKLTADEKREYANLLDKAYDAYTELTLAETDRFFTLGALYDVEDDRRREYMDEAYDRDEDFRD